jgi:hypothetical protein
MFKKIFFSFHYNDIEGIKGNTVRSHINKTEILGFCDRSLWNMEGKMSFDNIKKKIDKALETSDTTIVLIGSHTFSRFWVRYEIVKSLRQGNKLLGIHINPITDIKAGPNPFEYLRYRKLEDNIVLEEFSKYEWQEYWNKSDSKNIFTPEGKFSAFIPAYDWIKDCAEKNLLNWLR